MIVPAEVLAAVAEHAREVDATRTGHESVGCLVVDDAADRVLRYVKLHNSSRRPNEFQVAGPGSRLSRRFHRTIVTHSHPASPARPSPDDEAGARGDMAGIYSLMTGELTLWQTTRPEWTPIPFKVEA